MPHGYYQPEIYMIYNGVTVYRSYKDGNQNRPLEFWFNTSLTEDEGTMFDVRDLPGGNQIPDSDVGHANHKPNVIRRAIDAGLLPYHTEGK